MAYGQWQNSPFGQNVITNGGKYYASKIPNIAGNSTINFGNPQLLQGYIQNGLVKDLGALPTGQASGPNLPTYTRQPFTPNQQLQGQIAGSGMATPQWMMDAYSRKIQGMGGNANPPVPFDVTQSGFPQMQQGQAPVPQAQPQVMPGRGGKPGPASGFNPQVGNIAFGALNAANGALGAR